MPRAWPLRAAWRILSLVPCLLTVAADAAAAEVRMPLSAAESRIVDAVDRRLPAGLDLLERTVNVNSGTLNLPGVRRVGEMFAPAFAALGFETSWVDGAAWGRAGHLIARRAARAPDPAAGGAPRVLLIGHLDTVFESDHPFQRYERLDGNRARGPGVLDMKGGNVVMLLALGALLDAGLLDALEVEVVLTGDEERSGAPLERARRDLVAAADRADLALGFEDGDGDVRHAVTARRGSSGWTLRTSGRPGHSSLVFGADYGSGAIYEMARILAAFHDSLSGEELLTVNPGMVVGGTRIEYDPSRAGGEAYGKSNVIAESTLVTGDLRTISLEQLGRARDTMRRIVAANLPGTATEIEFHEGYLPVAPTAGNRALLALYDAASRDLGLGPVTATDPARAGAADISFTVGRTPRALDALGLKGSGGHSAEETVDLGGLPVQARRAAVMLARIAALGRDAVRTLPGEPTDPQEVNP